MLSTANISAWTSVCDDNALMRGLLESFFRYEYQLTAAFHKYVFLEDLAAQRRDFAHRASLMSFSAILTYGTGCVHSIFHRPD